MTTEPSVVTETIECPLCLGEGKLKRSEVLDRLGVKDFARVAQLSAEEAFRLLLAKQKQDEQHVWARFETELTKRVGEIKARHHDELHASTARIKELEAASNAQAQQNAINVQRVRSELEAKLRSEEMEKERATRRAEDHQREIEQLREHSRSLEAELSKVARIGKREEVEFAAEARMWPGVYVSDKLPKNGDFILAFCDPSGAPVDPRILVDCKDKVAISETDLDKLVRDSKERSLAVAVVVARDESQLRQADRDARWACKDGIWVLRTTRNWLPRDLDVLRPLFERMRIHGTDFLEKNAALAAEVRRTFADVDRIEKELKKAARAVDAAAGLTTKYRIRLQALCENSHSPQTPHRSKEEKCILSR